MADYKLTDGGVIRTRDGASIPNARDNRDWQEFQEWLAIPGNTPDPTDPPPVPETAAERLERDAKSDPFKRALVARIAATEGKTVVQVIAELRALA